MPTIEVNEKTYETDKEGYLVNFDDWNMDIAKFIAQAEELEMTDSHWEIIKFLRAYYKQHQSTPNIREVTQAVSEELSEEKGKSPYLYDLFPSGPAEQGCKIAGLPKLFVDPNAHTVI
ncbi:MAG: TusE/DsrC/DsvC family sulfur relay protein [Pseudomonadota bacterium]|jgi:TusE/DsrC/DsvC family sulfur relay protein|nr:TusE/DsrC/DsvC family sulfur relay protein [Pseudomonadota bacterium]